MRFVGLVLSIMILAGTGLLAWQEAASGSALTVRPALDQPVSG
ncbi:hypothetical protein [Maricaulis sp.]|nr:hypothetical protein [Maricaulis sp.]